jgi:hypothetical protein
MLEVLQRHVAATGVTLLLGLAACGDARGPAAAPAVYLSAFPEDGGGQVLQSWPLS